MAAKRNAEMAEDEKPVQDKRPPDYTIHGPVDGPNGKGSLGGVWLNKDKNGNDYLSAKLKDGIALSGKFTLFKWKPSW